MKFETYQKKLQENIQEKEYLTKEELDQLEGNSKLIAEILKHGINTCRSQ